MRFDDSFSFGNILSIVTIAMAYVNLRSANKKQHDENLAKLTSLETKMGLMWNWFSSSIRINNHNSKDL